MACFYSAQRNGSGAASGIGQGSKDGVQVPSPAGYAVYCLWASKAYVPAVQSHNRRILRGSHCHFAKQVGFLRLQMSRCPTLHDLEVTMDRVSECLVHPLLKGW